MLAIYTGRHVTPEVNLRERISHTPLQSLNKAEPTLALKPRGDITKSPKQGYQWPQKWTCVQQKFKKKKKVITEKETGKNFKWILFMCSIAFCLILIRMDRKRASFLHFSSFPVRLHQFGVTVTYFCWSNMLLAATGWFLSNLFFCCFSFPEINKGSFQGLVYDNKDVNKPKWQWTVT